MKSLILVAMAMLVFANPCIAADVPSIGSPPPALSLPGLNGRTVDISSYSGSPTVISFFASWSKPCAEQITALNRMHEEYAGKGVKVVGISLDRKTGPLKDFVESNGIGFDILVDQRLRSIGRYAILILPTTYLVGRDGNISNIFVDHDVNVERSIRGFIESQIKG